MLVNFIVVLLFIVFVFLLVLVVSTLLYLVHFVNVVFHYQLGLRCPLHWLSIFFYLFLFDLRFLLFDGVLLPDILIQLFLLLIQHL